MQIALLGPLEVRDYAGALVEVAGARVRTLLARLALDAGRPVSVAALVDAVWGDRPPAEQANALQSLVSRLRRALGDPALVIQSPAGYRLAVSPDSVDAVRFERLLAAGTPGEAAQALALWRGPVLADVPGAGAAVDAAAARLAELRLTAITDVEELERLVAENPVHERLTGQLMRALAADGRQADALRAYDRLRVRLVDELGVDPGDALRATHLAVLRGEVRGPEPARVRRSNLKAQLTSFVGREDDVARIGKALEQHRLVTLVGPGGAGKTRLAAEAAADVLDRLPDGAWLVELAPVTSAADVPQAVLGCLGLREIHLLERRAALSARDATTRLVESLGDKHLLLILDNCEHLIDASAGLADVLLAQCPGLRVLTTSREPLGIVGETLLAVPPLGQPDGSAGPAEALTYPAVRLFADRAAAVRPNFQVDDSSVAVVIEIVRRLDGLPLAIELAAARLRSLPLGQIAQRLSDRFRLLTGGSRTALPRHRTLRAVVEWSWDLLSAEERTLVEMLAVFPSGITLDSARAVAGTDELGDLLDSLVDKSLVQPVADGGRMRMLETIREYGLERLAERGAAAAVRGRHAGYFAAVLATAESHLTMADQLPWMALLADERDNILAAMRYQRDAGDIDAALRMALGLGSWAMLLGEHGEIAGWMADVLDACAGSAAVDPQLHLLARALYVLNVAASGAPNGRAEPGAATLPELARQMDGVDITRVSPLAGLLRAAVAFFGGEHELARRCIDELVDSGDRWSRAAGRMFAASLAENIGAVDDMRRQTDLALADFRELGERWGLTSVLRSLGYLSTLDGDLEGALAAYEEALVLAGEMHSRDDVGFLCGRLADVALRRDDVAGARAYAERACAAADRGGSALEAVYTLIIRAGIEHAVGDVDEARVLQRAAAARIAELPAPHPGQGQIHAVVLGIAARLSAEDGDVAAATAQLQDAFETALGTGDFPIVATVSVSGAVLATTQGEPERAAELLGVAARLRGADDRTAHEVRSARDKAIALLGEPRFVELYDRGKALDRDAATEALRRSYARRL